jgi:glyoxylase-like metal-dependent hydrolase (beta-lactamase superfamily II)/rhodanese-related sulfurtransferase
MAKWWPMIFRQVTHDDLGCASYLIGDEHAGVAAVVDPQFEIGPYLELARYLGVHIEHILETHTHADHVSGHGRLAAATGATIHIHRVAAPAYPHDPIDDGWELQLGALLVRAVHTPGHRPEHTAFTLADTTRADEPWALLSGDSLFVGDVARPDLAVEKKEGAREIFRSLHERLLTLPGHTEVWPAHLGGSLCGGPGMDPKTSSTIGFERAHSELLGEEREERFVERLLAGLGPQPPNFEAIVELNRGPLIQENLEAHPITPRQVEQRRAAGALLVDVRTSLQFDDAHVTGAVSITILHAGFGSRLAWLATRGEDVVLIGRDDEDGRRATELAAAVGITSIAGYLAGGMTTWREEGRPTQAVARLNVEQLWERTQADPRLQILDVRARSEWDEGHIAGSAHCPYHDIHELPDGIDAGAPVAAICSSGQRSAVAASLLQRYGAIEVFHVVDGGVQTWRDHGWPMQT